MDNSQGIALVVVDPLRRFSAENAPFEVERATEIIEGINAMAAQFRIKKLPVVWVSRLIRPQLSLGVRTSAKYAGMNSAFFGEWAEIDERLKIMPEDYLIYKPRHSSFHATDLDIVLSESGVKEVWLSGFTFNVCILATAFDAVARDLKVKFLTDLCGTLPAKHENKTISATSIHEYTRIIADYAVGEMLNNEAANKILQS